MRFFFSFTFFLIYLSYVSAFLLIACSSSSSVFSFRLRLLLIDTLHILRTLTFCHLECRCVSHFSFISCVWQHKTSFFKKKKVWNQPTFSHASFMSYSKYSLSFRSETHSNGHGAIGLPFPRSPWGV